MEGSRSPGARRCASRLVVGVVLAVGTVLGTAPVPAYAAADPPWQPPVRGPVVRAFVEPSSRFGPGHRGVDFATRADEPVGAAGRGTVVFAGDIAGAHHVVVLHRGGVRTSYSFLRDSTVAVGDAVEAGTVVGHAGGPDPDGQHAGVVHFGVRLGDAYVDPMALFRPGDLGDRVRLVPTDGRPGVGDSWARTPGGEGLALVEGIGAADPPAAGPEVGHGDDCGGSVPVIGPVVHVVCEGVDWAAARTRDALRAGLAILAGAGKEGRRLAARLGPELERLVDLLGRGAHQVVVAYMDQPIMRVLADVVEIGERFLEWTDRECSPDAPPADGTGGSGHAVMAVAGIGSASAGDGAPSFGLDVDALGYAAADVHWFSYAADGGAYDADDTYGDLRIAAKRLAAQLRAQDAAEPGREVDLIAHSQGGVVVERFLRFEYDASDPTFPPLGTVVTLASPHEGAPVATAVGDLRGESKARKVLDAADRVLPGPPSSALAVAQLAEDSPFMRRLHERALPDGIDLTTVGGTDDVVVPANRIHVPGATEVVVDVAGVNDHTAIHHDDRALQVVRSALEHRAPPCTTLLEGLRSAIEPVLVSRVEGDLGEYLTTYLEVRKWS